MAQAATRQRSAVRKRHADHPSKPKPAAKPGTPSSASDGGAGKASATQRSSGGGSNVRRGAGTGARRGGGSRTSGGGSGGESKLERGCKSTGLISPGSAELALPKPHLPEPHLPKPHLSIWARLAAKILKKIAKHELRRLTDGKHWSLESVAGDELAEVKDRLAGVVSELGTGSQRLPIQESVDIAVPLAFAWSQWMELQSLPEGIDRVVEIEREDGALSGRLAAGPGASWRAEVLDERECESFAWKSSEGSDCAGLVTFHSLGERLTRVELTLDVVPHDGAQTALLLTHLAHRRARNELRRFKAELEVVSPDVYAGDEQPSPR